MTEEYLNLRTEYRTTGVSSQDKELNKLKDREFDAWLDRRQAQTQNKAQFQPS